MKKKISITLDDQILDDISRIIDNINIRNRSQAIEYLTRLALGENKSAVILCGGHEKELEIGKWYRCTIKIDGKTVIERAVEKLKENGFNNIFVVARQIVLTRIFEILKDGSVWGVKINYIEEKQSYGSADSLRLLKGHINNTFLVVYGDVIFKNVNLEEIWNDHLKNNALVTLMMTTSPKPSEKGTLRVEGNKVLNFTQKPKKSEIYLVFSPIFVSETELFEYSGSSLEKDVFPKICERHLLYGHLSSEKENSYPQPIR